MSQRKCWCIIAWIELCLWLFPLLALFTKSFPLLRYAFVRVPHWNTFSLSRSSLLLTDMTLVDDFDTPAVDFITRKFIFFTHFFQMFTRSSWDFSFSPSITSALDLRPSEDLPTGVSTQVKSLTHREFFKTFKRIRKVCRCEWTQNLSKPRRSLFDADAVACVDCSSIGSCTVFFLCVSTQRTGFWVSKCEGWVEDIEKFTAEWGTLARHIESYSYESFDILMLCECIEFMI